MSLLLLKKIGSCYESPFVRQVAQKALLRRSWWFFCAKKKKARDMCDEIKKKQYWVNVMIYISDEIVQSNLDYPDFFSGPNLVRNIY